MWCLIVQVVKEIKFDSFVLVRNLKTGKMSVIFKQYKYSLYLFLHTFPKLYKDQSFLNELSHTTQETEAWRIYETHIYITLY